MSHKGQSWIMHRDSKYGDYQGYIYHKHPTLPNTAALHLPSIAHVPVEDHAQLIVAAPDLLAACEALVAAFEYYGNGGVDADTVSLVLAAVAKATGEQVLP
jgi:hypothetical protein